MGKSRQINRINEVKCLQILKTATEMQQKQDHENYRVVIKS